MKRYTVINNNDGNIQFKIEAKNYKEALEIALEALGWWIAEDK